MNEIKCPHCKKLFTEGDSGYADILKQIRDADFERELNLKKSAWDETAKTQEDLAVNKATMEKDRELAERNTEIAELKAQLKQQKIEERLSVKEAVTEAKIECERLKGIIDSKDTEKQHALEKQKNEHSAEVEILKDKISRLDEYKSKRSIKLLGEDFEQHCEIMFNQYRAAFPNARFGKDNDTKTSGTKGDYIFKDFDANGKEILSIMFDMKDERDETIKKTKNESHLNKLHKDRTAKGCEYAVLVSTLEPDNDFYNGGIANMWQHPKMYVVRPQCFISIILALRDGAVKSMDALNKLAIIENQETDVANFVGKLDLWKTDFLRNAKLYRGHIEDVRKGINDAIKYLQKVANSLDSADRKLELAENKAEDLTIKRLTHGNPTMAAKFAAVCIEASKETKSRKKAN